MALVTRVTRIPKIGTNKMSENSTTRLPVEVCICIPADYGTCTRYDISVSAIKSGRPVLQYEIQHYHTVPVYEQGADTLVYLCWALVRELWRLHVLQYAIFINWVYNKY